MLNFRYGALFMYDANGDILVDCSYFKSPRGLSMTNDLAVYRVVAL